MNKGGLGFDYKWDLGWMHDTLKYFECHPRDRANMPDRITFSVYYTHNERYILPFSHDEVVHRKKTIIDKLNGSDSGWQCDNTLTYRPGSLWW